MEKQVPAFFYDYKYYLFPEEAPTLSELKRHTHVRVRRLAEQNCMAPDFVYESIFEEELTLGDAARLFEVRVNLYSSEEYDALLRVQVQRICPGCARFGGDSSDLTGHHREISLSGLCYEREGREDGWTFAQCAQYFWMCVAAKTEELGRCIDAGDQTKLNRMLVRELSNFCFPVRFYGGVEDGQYTLLFCPDADHTPIAREVIAFLAYVGSAQDGPMAEAGWRVYPFRKKGVYRGAGKRKFEGNILRLVPSGIPSQRNLLLYHPKADSLKEQTRAKIINELHAALSRRIGEERVFATVFQYDLTADNADMIPLDEVASQLEAQYFEEYGEESVFPAPIGYGKEEAGEYELPFREQITDGVTSCPDFSFMDRTALTESPPILPLVAFAYLYVPRPMYGVERAFETLTYYASNAKNLIPAPIMLAGDDEYGGAGIGVADCGGEAFIVDYAVTSERKFFRNLRCLAPLLMHYGAKLVFIGAEGMMAYDCAFEFTPLDGK